VSAGVPYRPIEPLDPVAAQIAAFFASDPDWQALTETPPAKVRATIRAATPVPRLPELPRVEDFRIPVTGGEIGARLYAPVADAPALLIWAHGGGWVLGSLDEIDSFCRALAVATGCAVLSIEYRLAPEHPFPTAVHDLEAAVLWAMERTRELAGASGVAVFVGGDSAGATLATVVTRRLHAAGAARIAGNVLAYPMTEPSDAASLRRFEAPFLGLREVVHFAGLYCPDPALQRHPDFAPALAPDLGLLPPTLVITAGHDLLTEQCEAYARQLSEKGVPAEVRHHPGMIHGFMTLDAFLPGAGGAAIGDVADFLRRHR
jgi:acetyl esterase